MNNRREQLIPTADLADFYKEKIAIGLRYIYIEWDSVNKDPHSLYKINNELHQIFKQIKTRLVEFDYADLVSQYDECEKKFRELRPIKKDRVLDEETNSTILKIKKTRDFNKAIKIVEEKESLIWDCLRVLGLLGKVEHKSRRLQ